MNENNDLFKPLPRSIGQWLQRLYPIRQLSEAAVAFEDDPALCDTEVNGNDMVTTTKKVVGTG